jgi:hypothetical protein
VEQLKITMRLVYLLIIVLFAGCGSTSIVTEDNNTDILKNRVYTFADSDVRNLKIVFLNDNLIEVSNQVSGLQSKNYYRYNFTTKYPVKKADIYRYVIGEPVEKTDSIGSTKYVRPYRRENFYSRADVFPNVISDTLFFNENFKKIQLKDFSFELRHK